MTDSGETSAQKTGDQQRDPAAIGSAWYREAREAFASPILLVEDQSDDGGQAVPTLLLDRTSVLAGAPSRTIAGCPVGSRAILLKRLRDGVGSPFPLRRLSCRVRWRPVLGFALESSHLSRSRQMPAPTSRSPAVLFMTFGCCRCDRRDRSPHDPWQSLY